MRVLVFIVCLMVPSCLWAGAWPREQGTTFVATSANFSADAIGAADGYQSFYGEFGVTPKLTFGVKLWRREDGRHGDAMVFASYPLGNSDGEHRFAIGLGAGVRHFSDGRTRPILVPEFHWGKGFDSPLAPGWMSLSAYVGHAFGTDETWAKADFTFGLKPDDKTHLILQLRFHSEPTGAVTIFAPSYVRELRNGLHIEAGATYRLTGGNRLGLLLGTWVEF